MIIASVEGITYIYWASLYLHLFGAVAWLGGILFLTGVTRPIFEYYGNDAFDLMHRIKVRFLGFTWMLLWTVVGYGYYCFALVNAFHLLRFFQSVACLGTCKNSSLSYSCSAEFHAQSKLQRDRKCTKRKRRKRRSFAARNHLMADSHDRAVRSLDGDYHFACC